MFKDLFNEDNKSICVVTDVTDGQQKVVELGKDFDNYFDKTYGKAIKDMNATGASLLLTRKLKKRSQRQYKDICEDIFADNAMDEFVMKAFEEQFGNDSNKEN